MRHFNVRSKPDGVELKTTTGDQKNKIYINKKLKQEKYWQRVQSESSSTRGSHERAIWLYSV